MRVFRRSRFQRHLVIPLMLTCFLSGCYKWSVQPAPAYFDAAPERARITLSDGRVVELRSLEIRGDSVAGFGKTDTWYIWGDTLQTYPLADVTKLEVRKTDGLRTFGLVVGITAAALVAAGLVCAATDCIELDFGS